MWRVKPLPRENKRSAVLQPFFSRNNKQNRKKIVTHSATHTPPKIFGGRLSLHNRPASESRGGWALGLKE